MKLKLILVGKTSEKYLNKGIEIYKNRIDRYISFDIVYINELKNTKNMDLNTIRKKEAENIEKYIKAGDYNCLLDEKGKEFNSKAYANYIQKKMLGNIKTLNFIVGGAYGFHQEIYEMAHEKIALSKMTFSHQLVRLLFLEQTYRAFAILNNEPYHND
jgi:23S rRNA (pseudouridine1915-N3)-methyltransferase